MKKTVSLLLCFILTFSLASCIFEPVMLDDIAVHTTPSEDTVENGESTTEPPQTPTEPPQTPTDEPLEVLESTKYYKIEKLLLTTVRYSVYDRNGAVVLCEETDRPLKISMLGEDIVDICIGMGTGLQVHKYCDVRNNRVSEEYSDVAAASGKLVAYIDTRYDQPFAFATHKLVIRDIFDETAFCKSFFLYLSVSDLNPIQSARFTEGEEELEMVYRIGFPSVQRSVTLPIRRAVTSEDVQREAEMAMEAYAAALHNEIMVFEPDINTFNYLMNCKTPYNRIPLSDTNELRYVYMDADGDGVNELFIDCGDTLVLRYYKGTVYVYPFTFRNMYDLHTDGSYGWNHTGQDFVYGESKLTFDGTKCTQKALWKIVNDGEPNAAYYIEGDQVSQEALSQYLKETPKTKVSFVPLTLSMENTISREQALQIADAYWGYVDGRTDGACGTTSISRVVVSGNPNPVCPYYRIAWQIESYYNLSVEELEGPRLYKIETYKQLLVNIYTGDCVPYVVSEGGK